LIGAAAIIRKGDVERFKTEYMDKGDEDIKYVAIDVE
jgi:hypothetical protein